jgi:formylglycine-generating enzyme
VAQVLMPFFKRADGSFKSPKVNVVQSGQSAASQPGGKTVSEPIQTPTESRGAAVRAKTTVDPTLPVAPWQSLIQFRKTEVSPNAPTAVVEPSRRRPPWMWPAIVAASMFGVVTFGVISITNSGKNGGPKTPARDEKSSKGKTPEVVVKQIPAGESAPATTRSNTPETLPTDNRGMSPNVKPRTAITNTLSMKLSLIPAGEFLMGSTGSNANADANEKPQHRVRITHPFYLGVHEVTRGQFHQFVDAIGYQTEAEKDGKGGWGWNEEAKKFEQNPRFTWQNLGFDQTDEHPVVNVSWNDAQAFITWLTRKEGKTYRLPTEAEWEYACRAGSSTRYSFGDNPAGLAAVGNIADRTAKEKYPNWTWCIAARDGFVYTAPVGRYNPNAWGLFDMHGNVWEWCSDGYAADYYKQSPLEDPRGVDGAATRVSRGGCWRDMPRLCRSAYCVWGSPGNRDHGLGFRLARNVAYEIRDLAKDATRLPNETGKPPALERSVSSPDPVPTGSVWVGTRRFVNGYVSYCELKITVRAQTQFEGEMALPRPSDGNSRFTVNVKGDINGETVKFTTEQKEHFRQEFEGKLINKQMNFQFNGTARDGQQAEGTVDLTLRDINPSESPLASKAPRVVASWFAANDRDGWDTVNEDGSRDATNGLRVECNAAACWLIASDIANEKVWGWHAPRKYLGDHSEKFGRFLAYHMLTNSSNLPATDAYVRLRGGGKEIFVDGKILGRPFPGDWKTYPIRLDSSGGWKLKTPNGHSPTARDDDIKQVLSGITDLWIKGEYADGPDEASLRYVQFGGTP